MFLKRIKFIICIFILLHNEAYSQKVENLRFEQIGKQIIIYYDLLNTQPDQTYEVQIYCSTDGGKTFGSPLKMVTGNVGSNQTGGSGKKIVWDVLEERETLIGDIVFEIRLLSTSKFGSITDPRDGRIYKTIKIGAQVWMAENLKYKPITGNYWTYENNQNNVERYGYFYDWETANRVCPNGWRLPTYHELIGFFLSYGNISYSGEDNYFVRLFGEYKPDQSSITFERITKDNKINIPILENQNKYEQIRTMFWSNYTVENNSRAYAIFWRNNDEQINYSSVHFSSYPKYLLGFCRCIKN